MRPPRPSAPAGLTLTALGTFLSIGVVLPVLPRYVQGPVGGGELMAGVVYGAFAVSALAGRPVAGRLADRFGARAVLGAGVALAALAGAMLFIPLGVPSLIAARLAVGVAEAFTAVGGTVLAIDLAGEDRRGRAIGTFGLAMWVGLSLGAVLGEAVFRLGGYETVWAAATLVPLAGLLPLRRFVPPATEAERARGQPWLPPRAALVPGVLLGLSGFGYGTMSGFVVLHMDAERVAGGAVVLAVFALAVIAVRLAAGGLPDRLGARGPLVAFVGQAAGLGLVAVASSLAVALAGALLAGAGTALMFPALALMVLARVDADRRAAAIGGFSAFLDLGVMVSGPAAGAIAAGAGYGAAFGVAAAVGAATVLALLAAPAVRRGRGSVVPARDPGTASSAPGT